MTNLQTFSELSHRIIQLPQKHHQRLIAIDGGGGAGKTTFAACLQKEIPGSYVVKIDDFYRPPQLRSPVSVDVMNPNFDWDRIRRLVLEAVKNGQDISYQLYDFKVGTLSGEFKHIPHGATVILEGVWSMQTAFLDFYDYCIWLEAPAAIRLERGVLREGEKMRQIWEQEWIPLDDHYQKTQQPQRRANCIIDSAGSDFQKNKIMIISEIPV